MLRKILSKYLGFHEEKPKYKVKDEVIIKKNSYVSNDKIGEIAIVRSVSFFDRYNSCLYEVQVLGDFGTIHVYEKDLEKVGLV